VESERIKLAADSDEGAFLTKLLAFRGISTTYVQAMTSQDKKLNHCMITVYIKRLIINATFAA
jgi:hypothetical protein